MKMLRALSIAGVLVLAACQYQPAMPDAAPNFNGVTLGSGHRSGDSTTVTQTSTVDSAPADSVDRSGVTLGSGH